MMAAGPDGRRFLAMGCVPAGSGAGPGAGGGHGRGMNCFPSEGGMPCASEVEAQLQRVLDSAAFVHAPILSRFLRYVVEHAIADDGCALKEYVLGVDVFGRGADFDPRIDTIVRTNARRLRAKLEEYYRGDGSGDPIHIEVPKGHYIPVVTRREVVAAEAGHSQPAATPASSGPRARLPAPRAALVGRVDELRELSGLLHAGHVRLLTITGAGGSGKSRLALQAARDASPAFPGGVVYVTLAAATDGTGLVASIASALGVAQSGGHDLEAAIVEHLDRELRQPTLLVLDNCERIAAAGSLVGDWLDGCAMLKVLATSRIALRIYGEHEYPLLPLPVPECDPLPALGELASNPSVALFLQRAAACSRGIDLTDDNAGSVAELCRRLDGLPLSIELVASQAGNLTPASMLARFSGHLDLPPHVARDVPERQRTLRRTLDWSYELLEGSERLLFRRLAVFVGGVTAEGAEAVGNTAGDVDGGVAAALQGLVAKNLLVPLRSGEEPRYTMLDAVREYGRERLAASSEETAVRRAHAAYCLVLAEEGNGTLSQFEREAWLERCDLEQHNFLAAIAGLLQRGETGWAARLGIALFSYWERREHIVEADRQLRAILARCGTEVDPALRAKLTNCAGAIAGIREQVEESWRLTEQALGFAREAGDLRGIAASLNSLGVHRQFAGDLAGARQCYEEAVATCRLIGEGREIAGALSNLAKSDLLFGECEVARGRLEEALSLFREDGDPVLVAWCLNHLGDVAVASGDHEAAMRLYREGEALFRAARDCWGVARSCTDRGLLAIVRGEQAEAGQCFIEALQLFQQLRHRRGIALLLEGCAQLAVLQGRAAEVLVMAGAARQLRERIAIPGRALQQARLEQVLAEIRQELGADAAAACWEQGTAMPLPAAIAYALDAVRPAITVAAQR
jgi:predicted ATPase